MIATEEVQAFLAGRRIAVVGASDGNANFGKTIYVALREHGYEVVAVNPHARQVAGDPCYSELAAVPQLLDGVLVAVSHLDAADVVRDCVRLGVARVWLFKGIGGDGAVSDEVVRLCTENGIEVVAGACPLMFLEPVGWFHRAHRRMRRVSGSLSA